MEPSEHINIQLNNNLHIVIDIENERKINLNFLCNSHKIEKRTSGDYIIFDDEDDIVKVILYKKRTEKLILDDAISHPSYVETIIYEKLGRKCYNSSPHIIRLHDVLCHNNNDINDFKKYRKQKYKIFDKINKISINNIPLQYWNTADYYPKLSIIIMDKEECDLYTYLSRDDITIEEIDGIIFQIFYTLYSVRLFYPGFVHGNFITKNILMFKNDDYIENQNKYYEYICDNQKYYVKICQYIPKLCNFECSYSDTITNNLVEDNHLGVKNDIYRFLLSMRYNLNILPDELHQENKLFDEIFSKINSPKCDVIFNMFPFLNEHILEPFLDAIPNFSMNIPSLNGMIERITKIDTLCNLRNDHFDKNYIGYTYPAARLKGIVDNINSTIKSINYDYKFTTKYFYDMRIFKHLKWCIN